MQTALDIPYGEADGRILALDALQPDHTEEEMLPVILWLHGGGWQAGNKRNAVENGMLNFLVESGYVVVSAEYRLSSQATFPAQIHDVKAAIRWLRAEPRVLNVDPARVTVAGFSAGAHLAALAATTGDVAELEGNSGSAGNSSQVEAAVAISAPTDFARNPAVKDTSLNVAIQEGDVSGEEKLLGGPVAENLEFARMANPGNYVGLNTPPILLIHGTQDEVVPVSQADYLYETLIRENRDVTFVRLSGGNHGCWRAGHPYPSKPVPTEIERWVLDFLGHHILGKTVHQQVNGRHVIVAPVPPKLRRVGGS